MGLLFGRSSKRAIGDPGNPLIPPRVNLSTARSYARSFQTNPNAALGLSAVWACTRLRSDMVSSATFGVYQRGTIGDPTFVGKPIVVPQEPGSFWDRPSALFNTQEWLYASQISLDLRGNCYGMIVARDTRHRPTQIELLNPDYMVCKFDETTGAVQYKYRNKVLDPEQVWHERAYVMPGVPFGLSPIQVHAATLNLPIAARDFASGWFDTDGHPIAVMTMKTANEIDQKDAEIVKERFMAAVRGGNREPVVLGGAWDFHPISVNPAESQFIETQKYGGQDVARIFGVFPEMVGFDSGTSLTYTNTEQRGIQFLTYNMGPTYIRREAALSALCAPNEIVQANTDFLLRTDLMTRYRAYTMAVQGKWMPQDEVRAKEMLDALTPEQITQIQEFDVTVSQRITETSNPGNSGNPNDVNPTAIV